VEVSEDPHGEYPCFGTPDMTALCGIPRLAA